MRLDGRAVACVITAAVFAVAYSWQPPAEEPQPRASMKQPGPPIPKPSMFEVPKPPELPRMPLRFNITHFLVVDRRTSSLPR